MKKCEFFDREPGRCFPCEPNATAEYCRRHHPKEAAHAVLVADLACERKFLFDQKYDPNRTYSPVDYSGSEKMDWLRIPAGDTEFLWQLNRHRFFVCMGQAYLLTGDEKYARAFVELAVDWLDNISLCPETQYGPWRSLEAGLRGEYWCKAIHCFRESALLTDAFMDKLHRSMKQHARYLMDCHSPYRLISNWGIMENHGLFYIAMCLPQDEETAQYARFALDNLTTAVRMQIFPDGVHWEQSPMYHNEVLQCLTDVLILGRQNNAAIPAELSQGIYKMLRADLAWLKPDGHQFMTGDSDSNDIRDIIGAGALIFDDPELRFAGADVLAYDYIWGIGAAGACKYKCMHGKAPGFTSVELADSGHTYLRSGWGEDASLLHLTCGTMGAGHGHSDKLHIDLVLGGEDILMDGGRFTYVYGDDRREFKDPTGHNTITVDNKLFTVTSQTWEYSKMCQPVRQRACFRSSCEFAQAGHLGYIDLPDGVFVNRKVIYIKPDIYIIADQLYTGGSHTYQQYWHFNSRGSVEMLSCPEQKKVLYTGQRTAAELIFLSDISLTVLPSRVARFYGRAEDSTCVRADIAAEGFCSMYTVISPRSVDSARMIPVRSALKGTEYPRHMAEGIALSAHGREYVVTICHQEVSSPTDLVEADGCIGYGCVIVFDKQDNAVVGDVVCY